MFLQETFPMFINGSLILLIYLEDTGTLTTERRGEITKIFSCRPTTLLPQLPPFIFRYFPIWACKGQ